MRRRSGSTDWALATVVAASLCGLAGQASARVATIELSGIGRINGAPRGSFLTEGFQNDEVIDVFISIEETTADSDAMAGAGAYADPRSVTRFEGQASGATLSFTGFGFQLFNPTRLDQANGLTAPEGRYVRDWDLFDFDPPISDVDDLSTILAELPTVTVRHVVADGFAIQAPLSGGTTEFVSLVPTITVRGTTPRTSTERTPPAAVNAPTGPGQVGDCVGQMAGTVCRPSLGVCDEAEECDGSSPDCPPDTFSQFTCGTICRAAVDACDQPEFCLSFAQTGNFDCPAGNDTPCTPTPTETPTATPTVTVTPTTTPTPTSTPTFAPNENTAGDFACADDFDNDNDGLVDCEDPDCENSPRCNVAPAPATSSQGLLLALMVLCLIGLLGLARLRRAAS